MGVLDPSRADKVMSLTDWTFWATVIGLAALMLTVPPEAESVTPATLSTVVIVKAPVLASWMLPLVLLDAARLLTAVLSAVLLPMPADACRARPATASAPDV